ncbi:subtilisin-like protease SBT3.11 [Tasmannia lanceolata]|uniref:subtilisin-like protease SBT3.11 n=1 Tax=Tasmannia lanceolata TaxID=3420 RepID=UPI00406303A2
MKKSLVLLLLLVVVAISKSKMAEAVPVPGAKENDKKDTSVHIVYTERPEGEEEPETYHIRTLASVLGSEEAAKDALIYSYKNAASGFSARLTPQQVSEMSKQPGVLQVVPSKTYQLHSGPSMLH